MTINFYAGGCSWACGRQSSGRLTGGHINNKGLP